MSSRLFISMAILLLAGCASVPSSKTKTSDLDLGSAKQVVSGVKNWSGPQDCSAKASIYHGKDFSRSGIFVDIDVCDDQLWTNSPLAYQNDGIELYFDLRPDRLRVRNIYEQGVFKVNIIPDSKGGAPHLEWYPASSEVAGFLAETSINSKGYRVRVYLPDSGLADKHYLPRSSYLFDLGVNDADGAPRSSQLMWAGSDRNWESPKNFGRIPVLAQ